MNFYTVKCDLMQNGRMETVSIPVVEADDECHAQEIAHRQYNAVRVREVRMNLTAMMNQGRTIQA